MHVSQLHYLPLSLPFFLLLVLAFVALVVYIELRALHYAFARAGIGAYSVLFFLLASLIGSSINIPIAELPGQNVVSGEHIMFFGMEYTVPVVVQWPGTIVAINVGGAVIPILLSLYLLLKYDLWISGVIATACVAFIAHLLATPVHGVGIAEPIFVPPIAAAIVSVIISRAYAAPLAYISGSMGVLIGADLLNLDRVRGLGAPVASIGGAGTFDGIFLAGIIAVLLASFTLPSFESR
ncbi:MAG TPA: DUF1614 domain-containing protein [Methylovirgula sp.]|nr:DUF1614 domain-containing protein [Methylovirgula sp.]